jgi:NADPH-dependent curcumin reductase CurA
VLYITDQHPFRLPIHLVTLIDIFAMTTNAQLLFNSIPKGEPTPETFKYDTENTIDLEQKLENGACIVKVICVSLDPYMRGRMRPAEVKSYSPAFELHKPLNGHGVAVVIRAAEDSKFKVGDHVYGVVPYQQYIFFPGEQKVDEETKKFLGPQSQLRVIKNEEGLPWVRARNSLIIP